MMGTAMASLLRLLERGLASEAEDADFVSGLAEIAGGHGLALGRRGHGCGGSSGKFGKGCRSNRDGGHQAAGFKEGPPAAGGFA